MLDEFKAKMTDNEIIKVLECCTKGDTFDVCMECPLAITGICRNEENQPLKLALDLIKRQKAEIERLFGKQTPKKIEVWNGQISCPKCKALLGNFNDISIIPTRCKCCGQELDWSEAE